MNMRDEAEVRMQLVEYGKKLLACGLVQGTWGNLSIRLDDRYMITTPSGMDYNRLSPDDMVKVDIETMDYEGDIKPTSEKGLHAAIYRERTEISGVIHTHAKYCSVFAASNMPLQIEDVEKQEKLGEILKIADYALPGTKSLCDNTVRALGKAPGCIMSNHGMVCCGKDIEDAFDKCQLMEKAAEEYIEKRMK